MTQNLLRACLGLVMVLSVAQPAMAASKSGITLHDTRIVYPASAKQGVTLSLTNNTAHPYLMQSWMRAVDMSTGRPATEAEEGDITDSKIPFIVTPPLKRVDAGEQLTLLIRQTRNDLPDDRESVFFISVKAIPGIGEKTGSQLVVVVVNNIKLFYRPEGLPVDGIAQAAKSLRFSRQGDRLIVDNPTPFYLTFTHLAVGGSTISPSELRIMVPPKGQQQYTLPNVAKGEVQWQLLNENSAATPMQHQAL